MSCSQLQADNYVKRPEDFNLDSKHKQKELKSAINVG